MKDEARRGMRAGWADVHYRRHGHSRSPWGCGTGWGHPPSWAAPPPPDPSLFDRNLKIDFKPD